MPIQPDPHPTNSGHAAIYQAILDAESGLVPATYYAVNVSNPTGGSIIASSKSATPGSIITLSISPGNNMRLKAGTLKYNDGTADHSITGTSYILPAANITITAEFEQMPVISLQSITISKPATKLIFNVGDNLDLADLEVTGTYSDGSTKVEVVSACSKNGGTWRSGDQSSSCLRLE